MENDANGGPDALGRLRAIVARLRAPDGCPWDREQTHASLRGHLIEEAYEVADAIDARDPAKLREELGDFLLQVVLHAQIASESGTFDLDAVAGGIADKLVRRHPHVFGEASAKTSGEVLVQWEQIKRGERGGSAGVLDGIAGALPALLKAFEIQKKVARVGFDWGTAAEALPKLREEIAEIEAEIEAGDPAALEAELGDLLFSAVNLARKCGVNPELALARSNAKFIARFRAVEARLAASGKRPEDCTLAELDAAWDEVKRIGA